MKGLALAAAAGWSLLLPGPLDSGLDWGRFSDARIAYTLRIPPGWHATVNHGSTIVSSVLLPRWYANPEHVPLPRGGVYIWIFDYGPIESDLFEPRRGHLSLGRREVHTCGFGEGYMLHFRVGGRAIQAFVKLGPRWTSGREALAVLDSLRVSP